MWAKRADRPSRPGHAGRSGRAFLDGKARLSRTGDRVDPRHGDEPSLSMMNRLTVGCQMSSHAGIPYASCSSCRPNVAVRVVSGLQDGLSRQARTERKVPAGLQLQGSFLRFGTGLRVSVAIGPSPGSPALRHRARLHQDRGAASPSRAGSGQRQHDTGARPRWPSPSGRPPEAGPAPWCGGRSRGAAGRCATETQCRKG